MTDKRRVKLPGRFASRWYIVQFNMDNEFSQPVSNEDLEDEFGETGGDAVFNTGDACSAVWSDGVSYEGKVVFQSEEKEKCQKFRMDSQKKKPKTKTKRTSSTKSSNEVPMDPLSKKKKEANLEKKNTEKKRQETASKNASDIFKSCMLNASVGTCSTPTNNGMLDFNKQNNNVSCTTTVPSPSAQINMHVPSSSPVPSTNVHSFFHMPPPAVTSQPPNNITTIPLSPVNMHVPSSSPVPSTNVHSFNHMPPPAVTSQPPNNITTIPLSPVNMHVPSSSPVPSTNVHSFNHMPPPAVTSQPPNNITTIPLSPVNMHVPSSSPVPNTNVHSFTHMPPPAVTSQPPHNITNFNPGLVNTHVPSSAPFPYIATASQQPTYTPLVNAHVSCSVPLPYTAEPLHHYPNQHDKQVSASNSYVPSVLPPLTTSTNPLSNFTELTDLQPIDSLHLNNNCADCILKDKQTSSLQQYIEKLQSDVTRWREEATRLQSEIDSRTEDTVIQNDDLGKLAIFNSPDHYMPSRGTKINKCLYKISDVPDSDIPQGYMRLVEGHQVLIPVPWMNDMQGAYKGKRRPVPSN